MYVNVSAVRQQIEIQADSTGQPPSQIHFMSVGHWHTPWHGSFEMTTDDFPEYVSNFDQGIGLVKGSKKAPINYGHDITGKAAGWITRLFTENNGTELWGDVSWTKEGKRMLAEEEFKYISPEWNPRAVPWENPQVEGEIVPNVFTGAGLTNIPLFTQLKPVMASIVTGSSNNNEGEHVVDLKDVRTKKVEDLTEEEKTFLAEHKTELTDEERTSFGLVADPDPTPKPDPSGETPPPAPNPGPPVEGNAKVVSIAAGRLAKLEADAQAGRAASDKLARNEATALVTKHIAAGRIKSDQLKTTIDMLLASNQQQREGFEAFMDALPANKIITDGELGLTGNDIDASVTQSEKQLASAFNNTPEEIEAFKKEQTKKEGA